MGRRLAHLVRGVVALVALVAALVGPPVLLVHFVGNPLPTALPTFDELTAALDQTGIADQTIIKAVAILAWLVWVQLALALLAELAAVGRQRGPIQLPTLPGIQPLAGRWVAAVMLMAAPTTSLRAQPHGGLDFTAATPVAALIDTPPDVVPRAVDRIPPTPSSVATKMVDYFVQRHDSFWSIAEIQLGDGLRWQEIRELNLGRHQPDGTTVDATTNAVRAGWTLVLPADSPGSGTPSVDDTHVVEKGDHLWSIAEEELEEELARQAGDEEIDPYWREVIDHNRDVAPDPNLIHTGQQIRLPTVSGTTTSPQGSADTAGEPPSGEHTPPPNSADRPDPDPTEKPPPNVETTSGADTTHRVKRGDHLWSIAEEELEERLDRQATNAEIDPFWRDVINRNRRIAPNPDVIHAGQQIQLPTTPPATPTAEPPSEDEPTAVPVDEAERSPEQPAEKPAPPTTPTPDPSSEDEPAASPPTDEEEPEPSIAKNEPATATTAPPPSTATTAVSSAESADQNRTRTPADSGGLPAAVPIGLLGAASTGLATAVALTVARRRRARLVEATAGTKLAPPPEDLDPVRTRLHLDNDADAIDDLQSALATVAVHLADQPGDERLRRPKLVQLGDDQIEVLLDQPVEPAPDGWTSEADGAVWSRQRSDPIGIDGLPLPALVTIGRPDDTTEVLLDLEGTGILSLAGDQNDARALVRSIVLELVNGQPHDPVTIVVIGDLVDIDDEHILYADTWDDIADHVTGLATMWSELTATNEIDNTFTARVDEEQVDGLVPLIVIADGVPDDDLFDQLLDIADSHAAVAAVVLSPEPLDRGTAACFDNGTLRIPSLKLTCEAQGIDEIVVDDIESLLEAVDQPAIQDEPTANPEPDGNDAEPAGETDAEPAGDAEPADADETEPEVLVRVLGEISIERGHKPLTRKQLAVAVYIALHQPVSADRVEQAIWPEPMAARRRRLHNTMSDIRTALGPEHLPAAEESVYRTGPGLRTDIEMLTERVKQASSEPPEQATTTLRQALELVEGPVFTYRAADRASYTWVDLEHWISDTEAQVLEAACRLWTLYHEAGDHDGAIWAARRGLLASPANTQLTESLMRSHLASDDRPAAEAVYESHLKALDALGIDEIVRSASDLLLDNHS